jgi:hypothetical protein
MQKMESNDLLKSNENNEDNAKATAYINATIIIPSEQFHAEISGWIPTGFRVDSDRIPSYFSEWVGFLLGMLD